MMRGLLGEFGIHMPQGIERVLVMSRQIVEREKMPDVPAECLKVMSTLSRHALDLHSDLRDIERNITLWQRKSDIACRLMTIPGIGPIGASAFASSVADPHQFRSGREFAAWLGLTPRQNSSGGKERLGSITKMGDRYLRRLLVLGMTALVRSAKYRPDRADPRYVDLLMRKPMRVATVAMANKTARIVWAVMTRNETYRADHLPALAA